MFTYWLWNEAGSNNSVVSSICNTFRYLSKCVHLQPGGHLSGALQCYLQSTNITHVADQIPRRQGDQRHMAAILLAHGAIPNLQHARALPPHQQQHRQHVPPHLAQWHYPAVMVTFTCHPQSWEHRFLWADHDMKLQKLQPLCRDRAACILFVFQT